jgi:NAD(P)-dependent dehydrogenase (short-subunit alcohol dehydrogenase family)
VSDPVAVITGASRGIGAGLVTAYRRRGWAVVANARTLQPSRDGHRLPVPGDVSDPATCDRIVAQALDRFGRIDTLVNNAGLFIAKPFTDYTGEDYARAVALNLTAFFNLTQRVVTSMLPRRAGHVVAITTTLVERADSRVPAVLTR